MRLGAQFFTIREACKDLEGLSLSLRRVADMGYTTVQLSATCSYDPAWMAEQLRKNGLRCVLTHTDKNRLLNEPAQVCRDHAVMDCPYVGLGMFKFDPAQEESWYPHFYRLWAPAVRAIREGGRYFMYHNHAREFLHYEGETILRRMARDFSPEELGFTLDTYWVQRGGGDPAQYLEELKSRVPCIHLKDYGYDARMEAVGEGNINFDRVLEKAESSGTEYLLVEQDNCNGEDPFDCLRRSYGYLKAMGLE